MQLASRLTELVRQASKTTDLPFLRGVAASRAAAATPEELEGFYRSQDLALRGAQEIAGFICEGWTERQAADLLDTWLRDHGVHSFFHQSYAWYGERTRFQGINRRNYAAFMPSTRRILPGEVFILDVAPVFQGYVSDIGYTASLGKNTELENAQLFLNDLKTKIAQFFEQPLAGAAIWNAVDREIGSAGYDNIHELYPFSVLGHRVYQVSEKIPQLNILHFGWQSYWSILARGLFGQLLNQSHEGSLTGLWAIEPHIGAKNFGAKFEEILVVDERRVYWLSESTKAKIDAAGS